MSSRISDFADFLLHLDELKSVERKTYIAGGERRENSAEHSWHLAMACWCFADSLSDAFDVDKLIKMALVHDLGEIGAGDTFLYSDNRPTAHVEERESVMETASHSGNAIPDLLHLWDEQEAGETREAKLLKVLDRLLPFLHNITSEGRAWRDNRVRKRQVLKMHGFIEQESSEIWPWLVAKVDHAVEMGWLDDS